MYAEFAPGPGIPHIACAWVSDGNAVEVLPDGCVDVVLSTDNLIVAGPATTSITVPRAAGGTRCGIRFRAGMAGAALGIDVSELRDLNVPLEDVWEARGRRVCAKAASAVDVRQAIEVLASSFAQPTIPVDQLARAATLLATRMPVGTISRDLGICERQLHRRMERAVGYGPRSLARILRLQRFLAAMANDASVSLARLAADVGYADQAHLTRECRRLTGQTPAQLRAGRARPAGERTSETFKTDPAASGKLARQAAHY